MARRRTMGVLLIAVVAVAGTAATRGYAQEPPPSLTLPPLSSTTTSTTTPTSSGSGGSTTSTPSTGTAPGSTPTTADVSHDGDNGSPIGGGPGQIIPPDAQAILDSIVRSPANDNHLLVAGEKALLAAGVDP